ncbi:VCBS repeat-containing protein [Flavobacteriaceae bacterium]|nr:VCBS repeat-containing protein [Flavobacteriaceae bacterium]
MKKLLYPIAYALTTFLILYSCSTEEDATPPPQVQQPATEPEPQAPTQYTLTVTTGEGGTVSTEGGTYDEGAEVTITATPAEGYEFAGWEGSDSTEASLTITLGENINLQAVFKNKIIFEFEIKEGNGSYRINDWKSDFVDLYYAIIDAIPEYGWGLDYFSGDGLNYLSNIDKDADLFRGNFMALSDVDRKVLIEIHFSRIQDIISGNPYKNFENLSYQKNSYSNKRPFLHKNYDTIYDLAKTISNEFIKIFMGGPGSVLLDYNNDGELDLILPTPIYPEGMNPALKRYNVFFFKSNNGYLEWDEENSNYLPGLFFCTDSEVNDFNNDGFLDFLSVGTSDETQPEYGSGFRDYPILYLNQGNSKFKAIEFKDFPRNYHHNSTSGDIDNDGDIDIVLLNPGYYSNPGEYPGHILINDGFGNFERINMELEIPLEALGKISQELVDLNNDGYLDLVASGFSVNGFDSENNSPLFNTMIIQGNGKNFNSEIIPLPDNVNSHGLILDADFYDINSDGFIDIVLTRTDVHYGGYYIQVIKNLNGNEFLDITNEVISDNVLIHPNEEGFFSEKPIEESGYYIYDSIFSDTDGDGIMEFFFNNVNRFSRRKIEGKQHPYKHWDLINGKFVLRTNFKEF